MAIEKLHSLFGNNKTATSTSTAVDEPNVPQHRGDDKEAGHELADAGSASSNDEARPAPDAQPGVQKIEAVTLTWSKKSVFGVLILIWFLTLVNNMKTSMVYSLSAYATSSFLGHSLLTVISVVASAMAGAVYIPMAKALDLWGRAEGFLVMTLFCIVGLVLLAASHNIETYCAGEVFYTVGFGGLSYSWVVLAADVTSLRNRGLAFAFTSSPALISAFAGSKAAAEFLVHSTWRWGYAMWAIVLPFFALPVYLLLAYHIRKAEKNGTYTKTKRNYMVNWESIKWVVVEFDLVGVILFAGGMVIFLLPFTLTTTAPNGWQTDYIIAMIIVGFVLLVAFAGYEIWLGPVPFLNHKILTDRTVIGACLLDMTYQISYSCYASYLSSFLQVVYEVDVATAGYIGNTFSVVSFVFLFVAGWLIRWTGRFKWILWICVPLYIFGLGLMIHFRTPGGYIGYIVMCEVFFSVSGSIFILCVQLAVLCVVDHQHVAAVFAFLFVMGSIGGSIGSAICGAIWTNTFYSSLQKNLPESAQPQLNTIYESLVAQLAYAPGTPERTAIVKAYGYAQPILLATGTAFMVLGFIWVGMMRNVNVKTMTQTKGNVF
ncbi:MFS siderochrome iron transporter B [Pseudocercospora fuligena]|uniref:MFS siderochrome iron transporter B n=1 Tax=Pseudocercospora fuligena TaxID=685502 RepID=A0A8H6RBW6_9PEZI|nr:MFS siderochrome iron transporter B [Pseudocercospora fuligena]